MLRDLRSIARVLAAMLAAVPAHAAGPQGSVQGVVRDTHGVPQMGVLVELLQGGMATSAFTDSHGRYRIDGVKPGFYDLQTSAALFLPTLRQRLRVGIGFAPAVNLTLSGLLDESGWLRQGGSQAGGDFDDWKWTLRSPANRPLLRLVAGEETTDDGGQESESGVTRTRRAVLSTTTESGSFGTSGMAVRGEVGQQGRGTDVRRSMTMVIGRGPGHQGPFALSMESVAGRGQGTWRRVLGDAQYFPSVQMAGASGLAVVRLSSAQRMELGSGGAIEVGGSTQVLHAESSMVVVRPFAELSVHPARAWVVRYRYATEAERQGSGSLTGTTADAPAVVRGADGRLRVQTGTHQELALVRAAGRVKLQAAVYHDGQRNTMVAGLVTRGEARVALARVSELVVDAENGSARWMQGGLETTGARVAVQAPLGGEGLLTAGYVSGAAMREAAMEHSLIPRRASAVYVVVEKSLPRRGTELSASYRWQSASMLTAVAPFDHPECVPYLGLHVVQRLGSPERSSGATTALTLDGQNLLAEGYHDAADLLGPGTQLMSAARELRAGLSVTF